MSMVEHQNRLIAVKPDGSTHWSTLEERFTNLLNVKDDFGAAGDGATDDTAAIQAGIAAVAATKARLVFPHGDYRYTSALTLSGNTTIEGAGGISQATKLTYTGTGNALTLTGAGNRLQGVRIVASTAATGLVLLDAWYSHVHDVSVVSGAAGIKLDSSNPAIGCGWNSLDRTNVSSGTTSLALTTTGGWTNQNSFSRMLLRTSIASGGQVIWINGAHNNVFQHIDASTYVAAGSPIAVNLQNASHDNTFIDVYIDTNAIATGYFLASGVEGVRVLGGANAAGTPVGGPGGGASSFFHAGVDVPEFYGLQMSGPLHPATDAGAVQTGSVYQGSGVPNNANGNNGDVYFRTDTPGTANQRLYIKAAGAWAGIL